MILLIWPSLVSGSQGLGIQENPGRLAKMEEVILTILIQIIIGGPFPRLDLALMIAITYYAMYQLRIIIKKVN